MKKIFSIFLLLLISLIGVNADLTTNNINYYKFDLNSLDSIGTNDGIETSITYTTGIINNAIDFSSSTTSVVNIGTPYEINQDAVSFSFWVKSPDPGKSEWIIENRNLGGSSNRFGIWSDATNTNKIVFYVNNGASSASLTSNSVVFDNTWHMITITRDTSGNNNLYVDGILDNSNSLAGDISQGETWNLGKYGGSTTLSYGGLFDELSIFSRALTTTEITELYNTGLGLQYPYSTSTTPTIIDNLQTYYNSENISIDLTTDTEVLYMGYFLDGDTEENIICNNCDSAIVNLNELTDGTHTINFEAGDVDGTTLTENSFIIDTAPPIINIIGNISQDSLEIDFSSIFDVTDGGSGMSSCTLAITYLSGQETDNNFNIACDDTQTFTRAGIYQGVLTATDLAGNIETLTLNGTINPLVYVNFEYEDGEVDLYDVILTHPSGVVETYNNWNNPIPISPLYNGSLDLGTYTLKFSRVGFATENFTLDITALSGGSNYTFNVTSSKILVNIYDRTTNEYLTGLTELTLIATYGSTANTTTGKVNITNVNFVTEDYQLIAIHNGYKTESVYFTYNNQEALNVDIYMLETNITTFGTLIVNVQNSIDNIPNQLVNLLEWNTDASAFITVGQSRTDSSGNSYFNIELGTTVYKVTSTLNGNVETSSEQIINIDNSIIYITFPDAFAINNVYEINEILYNLTQTPYNITHNIFKFKWRDPNNLVTEACLKIVRQYGSTETLLDGGLSCVNSANGELEIISSINNTYTKKISAIIYEDDNRNILDTIIIKSNGNIEQSLGSMARWFVLVLIVASLGLGIALGNINILGVGTIISSWLVYGLFSVTIPYTLPLLITIVMSLMLYGTFKKRF